MALPPLKVRKAGGPLDGRVAEVSAAAVHHYVLICTIACWELYHRDATSDQEALCESVSA